jgi:uncharacterized protein YfaS (alpha-2-macroglobulin family)
MTEKQDERASRNRSIIIVGVIVFLCVGIFGVWFKWIRNGDFTASGTPVPIIVEGTPSTGDSTMQGEQYKINVKLSDGSSAPETGETIPPTSGETLSPEETALLLSRVPPLPYVSGQQTEFNLPAEILPPPQAGNKIAESFPPSATESAPSVGTGALQVLRFAPEGEVPIAPFVSVTFNQPMVPLGTLEDLAAKDVPVKIEPPLEGTWRWLGTKTLTFQYDSKLIDRLPKATEYRVTVPAGIQSANGNALAESVSWTFKTPPPKIVTSYPDANTPQPLEPLFFILFDQRIDPAAVLNTIQVAAGYSSVNLVLATQSDIEKDERVSALVKDAPESRWLAFRAVKPLPAGTQINVTVGPNTPSAEGTLRTTEAQLFSFSTYSPLKVEEYNCSWYNGNCPPLTPFYIRFNNPLDMSAFSAEMLSVSPEIKGVNANVYGASIEISGETKGQTTYTVTLSGKIKDIFGQELGKDVKLKFKVGKAEAMLVNTNQNFITLDPSSMKPVFSVYAINYKKLNLKVYSVQPADWTAFKGYVREWQNTDTPPQMPGTLLVNTTLNLNIPTDTLSQVDVDLSPYLTGNFGHLALIIEPPAGMFENEENKWRRLSQTIITWVQVTQIGLDAYNDHSEMIAWATDLKTGAPLSGVSIESNSGSAAQITGADGVIRFEIPSGATYLTARLGADTAILPRSTYYWGDDPWVKTSTSDTLAWYVFDDRKMYKPGEEVHVKGWLRKIGGGQNGDVTLIGSEVNSVSYTLTDPQGNSIGGGQAQVNALGGFDFALTIPTVTNLGFAQLHLIAEGSAINGAQYYHQIQIQEFRRPEFEVSARNESTAPYFAGSSATLAVEAKYYAGGGLPNAEVTWDVTTLPSSYSPPNWNEFTFGSWRPWWFFDYQYGGDEGETQNFNGKTDAAGIHYLKLDFAAQGSPEIDPKPYSVIAQGTVMDVNRQAWSSSTTLLIHPADVYIGLKSDSYFVEKGAPLKIDFIVADIDGNAVQNREVIITASRMEWKTKNGKWTEEVAETQTCKAVSTSAPQTCAFETPLGGSYKITALVTDEQGRKNQTQITRWVSGSERPASRKVEQEQVTLIPDKESYQPGDTAKILVQSPFAPAEGILTVSRSGILYTTRFRIESGTATLNIPIEEKYIPNLNLQVDLVGDAPRTDDKGAKLENVPPRPAFATAQLNLKIPPQTRTLALNVIPDQTSLEPGGETTLNVMVKDARGLPVADAELAVIVVDESVLALTNYQLQDPMSIFYAERYSALSSVYGRASIILSDPQALARDASQKARDEGMMFAAAEAPMMPAAAPMPTQTMLAETSGGMEDSANNAQAPIVVRSDFNPLANFSPSVRTGFDGMARVQIKVPDNLTRYRIMVVAVDGGGKQFGVGESNLTARLPLMVRPSAPRFLNFGDKFELPVVIQNQTDYAMSVDVAARAANLEISANGQRINIPANDRVEVRFPASTVMAGSTSVQIVAASGGYSDAATVSLPVYTPATSEAFATYGVIDDGAIAQPVMYPNNVFPQYGGLQINTSSTALQALTDSVLYLVSYPYECSEQLASRILAVASLRDVLTAFKAEGLPAPAEMESAVDGDIAKLQGMQNYDGGFPYWQRGFESNPFNTIHVTHALIRAQQKGFTVPAEMTQNALSYLRDIENRYPSYYTQETRWTLSAYALYVRNAAGERDSVKASNLLNEAGMENLSMESLGWLWSVIDDPAQLDAIRLYVNNHIVETAGAANFTTNYSDQTYLLLSSDRRTDAILLDALIEDNPQSDLIPKVVNGLLAHRTKGRWGNTQENIFVLVALDRYFNTYESQTPDFLARMWLGNTYAGASEFRGYTTDIHETLVPMSYVLSETSAGTSDLILSKEGAGRLYYRLALNYAPTDLNLKPLDMGFVVERSYEGVDNPEDVTRDANGAWHIKAGARVKVKIKMVADNRRYHVALVDPLPAGLEIINPALAVSQSIPQDTTSPNYRYGWWWWGPWYEHQNMRDSRAEAFTSLLWDGVYEYSYFARATTPGTFVVPPTKAEEMYSPEVFGRSASDMVVVE